MSSPAAMTVAVLRDTLKARGIESSGKKSELVERLERALSREGDGELHVPREPREPEAAVESEVGTSAKLEGGGGPDPHGVASKTSAPVKMPLGTLAAAVAVAATAGGDTRALPLAAAMEAAKRRT